MNSKVLARIRSLLNSYLEYELTIELPRAERCSSAICLRMLSANPPASRLSCEREQTTAGANGKTVKH